MRILCLNSGGFDSVVLLHHLKEQYPDAEIDTLFFRWGQHSCKIEEECAMKSSLKVIGKPPIIMTVPSYDIWGKLTMTSEEQYVPMRNLVFISMAVAYAEKNGYNTIALALIDNETGENGYFDCTEEFINGLNKTLETKNIKLYAPFINMTKDSLFPIARRNKVKKEDFFSCNTPKVNPNGTLEPCGECSNCKMIEHIYDVYVNDICWEDPNTPGYQDRYLMYPISEIRLLINNKCQFTCKHCFYGFDKTISPDLTTEEFKRVIKEGYDIGITHIHISGKEPLVNADIFELTEYMDKLHMTYDIVTNGVTIKKYIKELKNCKGLEKVFLSVDTLSKTTLRNTGDHIIDNIKLLQQSNIDTQITMDLYQGNLKCLKETLEVLHENGVNDVFIRAVAPIGNAKDNDLEILTCEDWACIIDNALEGVYPVTLRLALSKRYYWEAKEEDLRLYLDILEDNAVDCLSENLFIQVEKNCNSFMGQITVTSDGYVLGCGSQLAYPRYDKISSGNVREDSLLSLIRKGKLSHLSNYQQMNKINCFFNTL